MNPPSTDPTSAADASSPTLLEQSAAQIEAALRAAGCTIVIDEPTSDEYLVLFPHTPGAIPGEPAGQVELADTLTILAQSQALRALLLEEFGAPKSAAMLALMTAGTLDGELGAELDNFLVDAIDNDSSVAWEGLIDDEYPVGISPPPQRPPRVGDGARQDGLFHRSRISALVRRRELGKCRGSVGLMRIFALTPCHSRASSQFEANLPTTSAVQLALLNQA